MLLYVDDALALSSAPIIESVMQTLKGEWKMSDKGIISRDNHHAEHDMYEKLPIRPIFFTYFGH